MGRTSNKKDRFTIVSTKLSTETYQVLREKREERKTSEYINEAVELKLLLDNSDLVKELGDGYSKLELIYEIVKRDIKLEDLYSKYDKTIQIVDELNQKIDYVIENGVKKVDEQVDNSLVGQYSSDEEVTGEIKEEIEIDF